MVRKVRARRKQKPKTGRAKREARGTAHAAVSRIAHTAGGAEAGRIFLLSPANAAGIRARQLLSEGACFDLARRLRNGGAALGEIFSFISGLYFRGKLAYANAFAAPPAGLPGALVITASGGLLPPELFLGAAELRAICSGSIGASEGQYRHALERDARLVRKRAGSCEFVLLGSIATPKYIEPLAGIFGPRLLFPRAFVGRGDMSRGGLMLRCVRAGTELEYVPVANSQHHGSRAEKLPRVRG